MDIWYRGTLRTAMTANWVVWLAVVDVNKIVASWYETSTSMGYIVCTVSGTTISIGSVVTQGTGWSGTGLVSMDKLDTNRFLMVLNGGTDSRYVIGTVSGTVPTLWSYTSLNGHNKPMAKYLANWYVAITTNNWWTAATHYVIYSSSGTTTTTTYSVASSAVTQSVAICKLTNNSFAFYAWWTAINKVTIPWAWTTLLEVVLVPMVASLTTPAMDYISDNLFAVASAGTAYIIQWAKILNTFSIASIIASWVVAACNILSDDKYIMYFSTSSNWLPSFFSFLKNQVIGAIQNNSATILLRWLVHTGSGYSPWVTLYIGNPPTNKPDAVWVPYWIALDSTKLLLK